jgi:(p)ppGpp synthase/HD superfamily hydrolase
MSIYSARYDAALTLTIRAHQAQTRKGSDVPYATHPIHVATILILYGFGEDVAIAGLLHDVVEDQDVRLACIEADFGPAVAGMVASLSERKQEGGTARPWRVRKEEALEQLREADNQTAAVKAADVIHNTRSLAAQLREVGAQAWDYYSRGPDESLWYYHEVVAHARSRLADHPLVAELEESVSILERAIAATGTA